MTYLFIDIEEMKAYVGGALNVSMEIESISPSVENAYYNHLSRWLPETLMNSLLIGATAPTGLLLDLQGKAKKALAFLACYEYANVGAVQFGEGGMYRVESDSHKTVYKYQANEYKKKMLLSGYEAIERMIMFLVRNADEFADYTDSDAHKEATSRFINFAGDFRRAYNKNIDRFTFETLLAGMDDVEYFAIRPLLGAELFQEMHLELDSQHEFYAERLELLRLVRKAVANFTIKDAAQRNLVQLEQNKVVVTEVLEPQGDERKGAPNAMSFAQKLKLSDNTANRWMGEIKRHLDANIEAFPTYESYQAEQEEAQEEEDETHSYDVDTDRYFPCCGLHGACRCDNRTHSSSKVVFL